MKGLMTLFCHPIVTRGALADPLYSELEVALALESVQQQIAYQD
jgi:hypothetical protein